MSEKPRLGKMHWQSAPSGPRTLCGVLVTPRVRITNEEERVTCQRCQVSDVKRQLDEYRQECKQGIHG